MPINYNEYPPNWKTEIRPAVLARAGNCCEECGVPNHALIYRTEKGNNWILAPEGQAAEAMALDGVKFIKVVLTIAHLDHDIPNHDVTLDRLKALCQRCHLNYDRKHNIDNKKYGRKWKRDQISLALPLLFFIAMIISSCNVRFSEMNSSGTRYVHVVKRSEYKRYIENASNNIPGTCRELKIIIYPNPKNYGKDNVKKTDTSITPD